MVRLLRAGLLVFAVSAAWAQTAYTYVGQITANSVTLAWGTATGTGGANTIGRESASMGETRVRFGDRNLTADRNWIEVKDLQPDTPYQYEVQVNGKAIGSGTVRTFPQRAQRLTFFLIGDFGNGDAAQHSVAAAMVRELQRRAQTNDPVRFVLSVGDNVYSGVNLGYFASGSGSQDRDWGAKFFEPYKEILKQIPFFPTLGNHDGNSSENRDDLLAYLDNFFFPGNRPARWYEFSYGGLVDFFALDSTENTTGGNTAPAYSPDGEQSKWLAKALPESKAPWKIPYFHHPPFSGGPRHGASYNALRHWVDLFEKNGVRVVFSGHEHNFQMSEVSPATGQIRYIVSGAGGELRTGNIMRNMQKAHIEGWAAQLHFLVVEIDGRTMHITPIGPEKMNVVDRTGKPVTMPIVVQLP